VENNDWSDLQTWCNRPVEDISNFVVVSPMIIDQNIYLALTVLTLCVVFLVIVLMTLVYLVKCVRNRSVDTVTRYISDTDSPSESYHPVHDGQDMDGEDQFGRELEDRNIPIDVSETSPSPNGGDDVVPIPKSESPVPQVFSLD
jgi:hypothetical protein